MICLFCSGRKMTVAEDKNVIKLRPSKGENHIKNFDPYKIVMYDWEL